jgi:formylglycine-generating enzyme required for sulfatase activity
MKRSIYIAILLMAIFSACEQDPPEEGGNLGPDDIVSVDPLAGDRAIITPAALGVSFAMRYVPPGRFQRDGGAANVSVINEGYWTGQTEVTQELWTAVMGYNPSHEQHAPVAYLNRGQRFLARGVSVVLERLGFPALLAHSNPGTPFDPASEKPELLPVETVSWYDAIAFCNKLSLLDGRAPVYTVAGVDDWKTFHYNHIPFEAGDSRNAAWDGATVNAGANGYRLPTEMEWMWAAMGAERGGANVRESGYAKTFAGAGGYALLIDYVWDKSTAGQRTHQTGKKYANELGLFDMSGNVSEWCWDRDGALPPLTLYDYQGPTGAGTGRILKGTNFGSYLGVTLASRDSRSANIRNDTESEYIGFRIVRPKN